MKNQLRSFALAMPAVLFVACSAQAHPRDLEAAGRTGVPEQMAAPEIQRASADALPSSGDCPCFDVPVKQKLTCFSVAKIDKENFWTVEFEDGFLKVNIGTFSKDITYCAPSPATSFCGAIQLSSPVSCSGIAPLTSDQLVACNAIIQAVTEQQKLPTCKE